MHTPGPWTAQLDRSSWGGMLPPQVKAGNVVLALVECAEPIYTADGNDRDERAMTDRDNSNARLMAAAPDLLAALERLLEETNPFVSDTASCECGENGNGMDDAGNVCEHIQAQRAIRLAKGR